MSEIEKLLADVALEISNEQVMHEHAFSVLKQRLLPLLQTGQAMRGWDEEGVNDDTWERYKQARRTWDAALKERE